MRAIDTSVGNAMKAANVRGIYLVRLCFDSETVAWHSGFGTVTLDSIPYLGVGTLSTVSVIQEQPGVAAASVNVGMSGIKEEVVALFLGQPYLGRKAYVHFIPLDDNDQPITGTPVLLFRGTMDSPNGTMGSSASFNIPLKSRLADWERPRKSLYTDAEQQRLYPGDRSMEYIAQLSQKRIIWPRAAFLPDPRD